MKKIYFATKNKGKVYTIRNTLLKYGIEVVHYSLELPELRSDNLREIAKEKVSFLYRKIKKPSIAVDSGFYINSLNGFPKTFVNFVLETIGIVGILKLVEGGKRDCGFKNCLAYMDNSLSEPVYFESKIKGKLSKFPKGEIKDYHWSKLFLIFIPKNKNKTLAEMSFKDYQKWKEKIDKDYFVSKFGRWFSKR